MRRSALLDSLHPSRGRARLRLETIEARRPVSSIGFLGATTLSGLLAPELRAEAASDLSDESEIETDSTDQIAMIGSSSEPFFGEEFDVPAPDLSETSPSSDERRSESDLFDLFVAEAPATNYIGGAPIQRFDGSSSGPNLSPTSNYVGINSTGPNNFASASGPNAVNAIPAIATNFSVDQTATYDAGANGWHPIPQFKSPTKPNEFGIEPERITAANRNAATMMGGWNPALRSIMVMNDGSRWFAAEQGSDVNVNSVMVYYRQEADDWKEAGSVILPRGIQQNMATITDGQRIYSYGVTANSVVETWFDVSKPGWNLRTSNTLTAGGQTILPGANSNYVGAAWHDGARVVWWTTVGQNGVGGRWSYAFNKGGGWNGAITSPLNGVNDVGYVRAQFDDRGRMHMIGESFRGHYPIGTKYLSTATITLGNAANWNSVLSNSAFSPLDVSTNGATFQYLYRTRLNEIGYSAGLGAGAKQTVFKAMEARFIDNGDSLGLVLAYADAIEIRIVPKSETNGFIDWKSVEPTTIALPASFDKQGVSAIWNVDASKQPSSSKSLEFAIAGAYPAQDHLVYWYSIPTN